MARKDSSPNIIIHKVEAENWESLSECWLSYVVTEPMLSAVGFDCVRDREALLKILKNLVKPNSPQYALLDRDNGSKVVGCLLSEIVQPPGAANLEEHMEYRGWTDADMPSDVVEKVVCVETLLSDFETRKANDIFRDYGVDKVLLMNALYLHEDYRGHGYSELLVKGMIEEAQSLQIPFVCALVTSSYSQRLFLRFDFELLEEIEYKDNFKYFLLMSEENRKLHTKCAVLAKKISQNNEGSSDMNTVM